jgi:hypothetical protein
MAHNVCPAEPANVFGPFHGLQAQPAAATDAAVATEISANARHGNII